MPYNPGLGQGHSKKRHLYALFYMELLRRLKRRDARVNIVVYEKTTAGAGLRLQRLIETLVPREEIEIHQTIDSLSRRLRQPIFNLDMAVLLATTKEELEDILSLRDLLSDVRSILVLPDREGDTNAQGHTLRPRFITYADSDFVELAAVLTKMLENANLTKKERGDKP
jgi:hypothetical protein